MKRSPVLLVLACILSTFASAQNRIPVPDDHWHLWLDKEALWQKDSLMLPENVDLTTLPVNAPSGSWTSLNGSTAAEVTLPATVEEYYWGANGYRPYKEEYAFEKEDTTVRNGNYLGVSWWWRDIDVPKSFTGKHAILHIRGARLRAEVFWNETLVGYNILSEIPFDCDITKALRPGGKNRLAIRITNPGGRLDWVDTELLQWGTTDQKFHKSHGFGGLDRGIELTAVDPVFIQDAWVLNTANAHSIDAHAIIRNLTPQKHNVRLRFEILDAASHTVRLVRDAKIDANAKTDDTVVVHLEDKTAQLWSIEIPALYRLRVTAIAPAERYKDARTVTFGFRWFDAEGIGSNAQLMFNGKRIRLTSAISWGFWGINGLWPTPELAEREVRAAKALGLNCIQFHRNVGKTEVLDAQDRMGLLRYMEPGGGQTAFGEKYSLYAPSPQTVVDNSGTNGDAQTFAERYMEDKIIRMVRAHRSHPSLVMYSIQNEIHPDLHNPRVFRILRRIHEEDPSRIVVTKSGFPSGNPSTNQAWMKPYQTSVMYDSGNAVTGWWDDHTVGGPGVWRDDMYKSPVDFTHRSTNDREIVMWGEMLGAAVADNHVAMVRDIQNHGGKSYDLKEHEEIIAGYDQFIDRWGFRSAFPRTETLFTSIGNKSYDFWGRVIETARLAESNDYFVISGWESTAIENHSGLVDNLRGFKGDPDLLKSRLAPIKPVIKTGSVVFSADDSLYADIYLLNETDRPNADSLIITIQDPSGTEKIVGIYPVPLHQANRFVYPVAMHVPAGTLHRDGEYTLTAKRGGPLSVSASEKILVVKAVDEASLPKRIGVISSIPALNKKTELYPGVRCEPYVPGQTYDVLIAANRFTRPAATQTDPNTEIAKTDDDELYRSINYGDASGMEFLIPGLPKDTATVTLKFAELFQNAAGMRVFDVALNGEVVLKDFDVFKEAGGKNIAVDKVFRVPLTDGALNITFPRVPKPSARICGIKIEVRDTVIGINCGGADYVDKHGLVWKPYGPPAQLNASILEAVRRGTPLIVLSEGEAATETFGKELGKAGAFEYKGYLGESLASWMGSWYFVRQHPLYDGLPVNSAMQSYYQVPVTNGSGLFVEGKNVEIIAAYSRDHSRKIAAGTFTSTLGAGTIVFHSIPGVVSHLIAEPTGMHPVMVKRLIENSLKFVRH